MRIAQAVAEIVSPISASSDSLPCSTSFMAPSAVTNFDTEATRNMVLSSIGWAGAPRGQALAAEMLAVDDLAMADRHHRQAGQRHRRVVCDGPQLAGEGAGLRFGQGSGRHGAGGDRQGG
jgi:hypothetical protein